MIVTLQQRWQPSFQDCLAEIENPVHIRHTLKCTLVGSLKMNTALEYSTRVVQERDRRCKKSTLNDLAYLTPLRIPLMNPVLKSLRQYKKQRGLNYLQRTKLSCSRMIRLHALPLPPLSRQQVASSCVSLVQITDGRGRGRAWSQIVRPQESLVAYESFNTLCQKAQMTAFRKEPQAIFVNRNRKTFASSQKFVYLTGLKTEIAVLVENKQNKTVCLPSLFFWLHERPVFDTVPYSLESSGKQWKFRLLNIKFCAFLM